MSRLLVSHLHPFGCLDKRIHIAFGGKLLGINGNHNHITCHATLGVINGGTARHINMIQIVIDLDNVALGPVAT